MKLFGLKKTKREHNLNILSHKLNIQNCNSNNMERGKKKKEAGLAI